jgi:ribosomal protein S18 acetylase RimI-like enzyme
MSEGQRERWLAPGELEFVELGVHPSWRRRGIGGQLHDELLARAARLTAVLATEIDNQAAIAFYEGRGWQTIIPEIRIGQPYRVRDAKNRGALGPDGALSRGAGSSPRSPHRDRVRSRG